MPRLSRARLPPSQSFGDQGGPGSSEALISVAGAPDATAADGLLELYSSICPGGTMTRLPIRLERPPLVEAVLELRFDSPREAVGDLLPGMVYGKLKNLFDQVEPLALAAIPREMRRADADLKYRPHVRLTGSGQSLLLGDHVAGVSRTPPYAGWAAFRSTCEEALNALRETKLLESLERFSFKCVNLLEHDGRHPLSVVDGALRLGSYTLSPAGLRVRAEVEDAGFVNIVELASGITIAWQGGGQRSGLMLSVDTLRPTTSTEFWPAALAHIDAAHAALKSIFFSLLTPEIIEDLGPVWGEQA
jgi:uncharacterized protein (TIGR04255 family)